MAPGKVRSNYKVTRSLGELEAKITNTVVDLYIYLNRIKCYYVFLETKTNKEQGNSFSKKKPVLESNYSRNPKNITR